MIRFIIHGSRYWSKAGDELRTTPRSFDFFDWDNVRNWYKIRLIA